jgi:hypothetical protein
MGFFLGNTEVFRLNPLVELQLLVNLSVGITLPSGSYSFAHSAHYITLSVLQVILNVGYLVLLKLSS